MLVEIDDGEGFIENGLVHQRLRIGVAHAAAQPGLSEGPDVLRGIMCHNKRNLGVYATRAEPVTIRVGDPVSAEI
ncbi:hypothetical protein ACQKP1_20780 [Allorhizobium sp. NPDC080224]|uniref:hypothetical protein n=1 Tax=Allorhizobium sp. NPDC080224 TaxID=3390547 RepID=UPI003D05126C